MPLVLLPAAPMVLTVVAVLNCWTLSSGRHPLPGQAF